MTVIKKTLQAAITAVLIFALSGCSSLPTYNFKTSQTVIRTAVAESKAPKELKNKALVIFVADAKKNVFFENVANGHYGQAAIDKKSFAAFTAAPGEYRSDGKHFILKENQCYFFSVDDNVSSLSLGMFLKKYHNRFLIENCVCFGDVCSVENCFVNKVSGAEVFGHYAVKMLEITGYVILVAAVAGLVFLAFVAEAKANQPEGTVITDPFYEVRPIYYDRYGRPVKIVPAY